MTCDRGNIGFRLKQILRNKKLTIKNFSQMTGISINTLYSITKRDSKRVDRVLLHIMADTLDISVSQLTGEE